ncbi:hypothetical protein [Oceanobacillus sp. CF4.6]|uniref:hypothetical protein n=1 Tax=Oceanobacillus sp. CF4.6 TaxID=3373080 RepID=UPI003EE617D8
MGYILPVDHYQYNDYQKRVVQQQKNNHFIEGPFKVVLDRQHQEFSSKYDALNRSTDQKLQPRNASEELIGLLTGKGRHFSDFV